MINKGLRINFFYIFFTVMTKGDVLRRKKQVVSKFQIWSVSDLNPVPYSSEFLNLTLSFHDGLLCDFNRFSDVFVSQYFEIHIGIVMGLWNSKKVKKVMISYFTLHKLPRSISYVYTNYCTLF